MSALLGPGDWVECIGSTSQPELVRPGGLYRVEDVVFARGDCPACGDGAPVGLLFAGHPRRLTAEGDLVMSWCPCRFRPIHPGGALTRLLMEPVSDRIEPGVSRKSRQDQPAHDEPVSSLREVA